MYRNQTIPSTLIVLIVRTYLTGLTMPLPNTRRTQTYKLTVTHKYTNLHSMQLIKKHNSIQLTNECRHAPKRPATTVCFAPGPALDLGNSLLTPTVVVALALGTSSPRPGRTPLTTQ